MVLFQPAMCYPRSGSRRHGEPRQCQGDFRGGHQFLVPQVHQTSRAVEQKARANMSRWKWVEISRLLTTNKISKKRVDGNERSQRRLHLIPSICIMCIMIARRYDWPEPPGGFKCLSLPCLEKGWSPLYSYLFIGDGLKPPVGTIQRLAAKQITPLLLVKCQSSMLVTQRGVESHLVTLCLAPRAACQKRTSSETINDGYGTGITRAYIYTYIYIDTIPQLT